MHRTFHHRIRLFAFLLLSFVLLSGAAVCPAEPSRDYYRIVVLGDPHLPGNHIDAKKAAVDTINAWNDVDLVACIGDVCKEVGWEAEYKTVGEFFARFTKPFAAIVGNHDYLYSDDTGASDTHVLGSPAERSTHLNRFMNTFKIPQVYFSRNIPGYHLVFLSINALDGKNKTEMSEEELKWFEWDLYHNASSPTIVFFHAPAWEEACLASEPKLVNWLAQPVGRVTEIVAKSPQVFLWVAGHIHLGPNNPAAYGPMNLFLGRVQVINNCDLDGESRLDSLFSPVVSHDGLWTTSLYLYKDRVVARIFDHKSGTWLTEKDRTIPLPTIGSLNAGAR